MTRGPRRPGARPPGPRRPRARWLAIGVACAVMAAAAAAVADAPAAEVALVGGDAAVARVRAAVGELLARDGVAVTWSRAERVRPDDVLADPADAARSPVAVWIDLGAPVEARLYFRDARRRRFVIRRAARRPELDAIAVEEIAQMVRSVVSALGAGPEASPSLSMPSLSLPEARAALGADEHARTEPADALAPAPAPVPPSPPPAPRPAPSAAASVVAFVPDEPAPAPAAGPPPSLAVEIGPAVRAQIFARGALLAERIDLELGLAPRRGARAPAPLGAWLALGYELPVRYRGAAAGADVDAALARAGIAWEPAHARRVGVRFGLGAGVDRISFTPRAEAPDVAAAPGGRFLVPVASAAVTARVTLSPHLGLAVGAVADVTLARVHFDLHDATGGATSVLVPFTVRPGLALGLAWRL